MRRIWDISPKLTAASPVFPGDTPFTVIWNERINEGGVANISTIRMTPHIGAHVDAPMHLNSQSADVASLRLETFIGRCRVLDLSQADRDDLIEPDELVFSALPERVLLKTRREQPLAWSSRYRAISPATVRLLKEVGVVVLGVDTPSVDPADSTLLTAHRIALANDMVVIENLDLTNVSAGDYELIALPLNLAGVEASPVRAVLRSLIR